ncbi:MAG: hypothetical protein NXI22_21065, partial [bacterium]|nr:hypothetical protein [bacterium]
MNRSCLIASSACSTWYDFSVTGRSVFHCTPTTLAGVTMGAWGSGLYACDIAKDLKSTVSAVLKLPFPEERLVEILEETFPEASQQLDHEEHTIFWLVLADQF